MHAAIVRAITPVRFLSNVATIPRNLLVACCRLAIPKIYL